MDNRRVVITALGGVSPIGLGKDEFWKASLEGKSGVDSIKNFDTSLYGSQIAGQIKNFNPQDYLSREISKRGDRFVHLGLVSVKMALEDSGLDLDKEDRNRTGVIFGSGLGGVLFHEEQILKGYEKGTHRLSPFSVPRITPNALSSQIAIYFNLRGTNMVIANACASGTNAIGESYRKIKNKEADIIFTGGAEAPLTEFTFGAYDTMRVLSKRNAVPQEASRPFDKNRDGFVMGEGASVVVLEQLKHALGRNARIYAEIIGYGNTADAFHFTAPEPGGDGMIRVMRLALNDAGINPQEIKYINAHGTSTVLNDKIESEAIMKVFGDRSKNLKISSIKSMIGHLLAAAGSAEFAATVMSVYTGKLPPTINYEEADPECPLDYVTNGVESIDLELAMSNSFGFGGGNVCLIIKKYES